LRGLACAAWLSVSNACACARPVCYRDSPLFTPLPPLQGDSWALLHSLAALCRVLLMTEGVTVGDAAGGAAGDEAAGEAAGLDLRAVQEQQQALELLR
jgi:hypothetical protein